MYSVLVKIVRNCESPIINQKLVVSLVGSVQVFLSVGKYPRASTIVAIKTDRNGLLKIYQIIIESPAKNIKVLSFTSISLVPYFRESKTIATLNRITIPSGILPSPAPPYKLLAKATELVMEKIIQV